MNERIRLLALEAGMRTTHLHYGRKDPYVLWENDIEKFAKLIVEECKNLLFESSENNRLPIAVDDMNHIIDTHFGIK